MVKEGRVDVAREDTRQGMDGVIIIDVVMGMDKKHHRMQEGWDLCGPAAIQMVLLAAGIQKSQAEIAQAVVDPDWGTSHQAMVGYLKKHFGTVASGAGNSVDKLEELLEQGHEVIVNWWDDFETELPDDYPDGHYCPVHRVVRKRQGDRKWREVELFDSATVRRTNGKNGIYTLTEDELMERWHDTDQRGRKIAGWLVAVNPKSRLASSN